MISPSGHRLAELLEERARRRERLGERQVAQLEALAEQDERSAECDLTEQCPANPLVVEEVLAGRARQVEVGDDRRSHAPNLWLRSARRAHGLL